MEKQSNLLELIYAIKKKLKFVGAPCQDNIILRKN